MSSFIILLGGMPATGKTSLGKKLCGQLKVPFFDKDLMCDDLTNLLTAKVTFPNDRSSTFYNDVIRDIEYKIMLNQSYEHLKVGISSVCISPFTKEFQSKESLDLIIKNIHDIDPNTKIYFIALTLSPEDTKQRMVSRGRKEDLDKLNDWESYIKSKVAMKFQENVTAINSSDSTECYKDILNAICKVL